MLTAETTGFWSASYTLAEDGTPITTWDPKWWTSGGSFELDGHRYTVKANGWGTRYTLIDDRGAVAAETERVGRKNWRVLAGGRVYDFRRRSVWSSEENLVDGDRVIGVIKRAGTWSSNFTAELPGLPRQVQVFVLAVQITAYRAASAAAAA
jgi:hypothetical protein